MSKFFFHDIIISNNIMEQKSTTFLSPCSKNFFKLLNKAKTEKLDKYDCMAFYIWDKVFKNDPEYQKTRKQIKTKSIKIGLGIKMRAIKSKMGKNIG